MIEIFSVFKNTKGYVSLEGKFPIYFLGTNFKTKYIKILEVEFKATSMLDMVLERQSFTKTLVLELQDNKKGHNSEKFKVRLLREDQSRELNFYRYRNMYVNLHLLDTVKYLKESTYFGVDRNRLVITYNIQKDLNVTKNTIDSNVSFKTEEGSFIHKVFKRESFCINTKTFDLAELDPKSKVTQILNTELV